MLSSIWTLQIRLIVSPIALCGFKDIDMSPFSLAAEEPVESSARNYKKLGPAGIALHYASIISHINTLVSD